MPVPIPPATPSTPPVAPQRTEPTTFSARMDAWLAWFNTSFWVWVYNLVPWIQARANETEAWSNTASASAAAASVSQATAAEAITVANAAMVTVTQQAAAAAATSGAISSVAAAASASATSASASSTAAAVARDAAIAAWAASTAPAEQLASISQSLHIGTIVKAVIYDTSKDSDGGAWRKRMQDKSWFNETLGGDRWIGQQATIAAAWTAAGSTTGSVFQASATAGPLTSGKYYAATSATTATEVTRGISREFPALPLVVAQTATFPRVVVYDGSQSSCPMWRVFTYTGKTIQSAAAFNGRLYVATTTGVFVEDLVGGSVDKAERYTTTSSPAIVNNSVNDVAITVLDTAPIDPSTGLPVPTIAVTTASSVSVIKDNGTVVNIGTANQQFTVSLIGSVMFVSGVNSSNVGIWKCPDVTAASPVVTNYYATYGMPQFDLTDVNTATKHIKTPKGLATMRTTQLALLYENPADATKGLHAHISNAYNSGWLPGDIRGAYLADTTAETVTASGELVTNGTFTSDLTGWTPGTGWAWSAGVAAKTAGTASNLTETIATVVGRTYSVVATVVCSAGAVVVALNGAPIATLVTSVSGAIYSFVATATTASISFNANATFAGSVDDVSAKLCEPDRSVKNKGLVINGSLTKTAVASVAGLVAYSGFSAANYLEQPYNSDLDFGTGDTGRFAWIKFSATAAKEVIWCRDSATTGVLSRLQVDVTTSVLSFTMFDGTTTRTATGTVAIDDGIWHLVETRYSAGTLTIMVDGVSYATATGAALLTMNNATAVFRVGVDCQGANPSTSGSITLARISATVASNDQSSHIYRTELPLFQAGAQCTIAGTSTNVTALAYDDVADELHVGTSWGRSEFKDLLRVASEATTTGSITSLSASEGVILTGGTSAKVYAPAMYLRDELRRKDVARKALGRVPAFFDYTATASQTAFVAPAGFTVKALYKNGTLMREATTGVYWSRSNDGFKETATLSVGASVSDWISLMCVRV